MIVITCFTFHKPYLDLDTKVPPYHEHNLNKIDFLKINIDKQYLPANIKK